MPAKGYAGAVLALTIFMNSIALQYLRPTPVVGPHDADRGRLGRVSHRAATVEVMSAAGACRAM
jgi:hypothetical protein